MSESFADRLKAIRTSRVETITRPLSQKGLAKLTGLPATSIAHYESGRREPSFRSLIKIARALGVKVSELAWVPATPKEKG